MKNMKKIIKITKIFLVLLTIFSQLSPAATALADEIVDNYESVENSNENVKSLAINGYLNYNEGEITKSLDGEMNSDNLVIYNVNAKVYTQILTISGDEIEDDVEYSVKVNDNESTVITGSELKSGIMGTTTDFTNSFNTTIEYTDTVVISKIDDSNDNQPLTLTYNAMLVYEEQGNSFDEALNNLYDGYTFENNSLIVYAKELSLAPVVPSMQYLYGLLNENNGINLEIFDRDKNIVTLEETTLESDPTDKYETVEQLIKNGYTLKFTKGLSKANYNVVVMGDVTDDSIFDENDMLPTMNAYLNEEIMPTMDLYLTEHETDVPGEFVEDPFGTITFEDVMLSNKYLNRNDQEESTENINLSLVLDYSNEELYVGDTFEVKVVVKSDNLEDFINGISGIISTNMNLKLIDIKFNDKFIGTYNDESKLVGAGQNLTNDEVVMTVEFMAIGAGEGTASLVGNIANDLNIKDFEELSLDVNIIRKNSNNNLASLNASVGSFDIAFDKDVSEYTLTVPYDTESVILSGSLEDINATVDGLIEYKLNSDNTTAIITVTAEDGSKKTYTVYIVKESKPVVASPITYYYSSNNYLKSLEIDNYDIAFDKEITEYKINVDNDVTSLDIKAVAEDSRARVEITGNESFKKGENTVTITVTAEDGTTREYKLLVNKSGEKKNAPTEIDDSSNTAEKVVIIILIILVVLGLLYLIFKKDDEEEIIEVKKEEVKKPETKKKINSNKNKKER